MDYGLCVRPVSSSEECALISDPLMGNLFTGISLLLLDMMAPSLSLLMCVLTLLSSREHLHPPLSIN